MPKPVFDIDDALLFEEMLSEEDRMIMDAARQYAQSSLEPRALEGNQDGKFHMEIAHELGELGLLESRQACELTGYKMLVLVKRYKRVRRPVGDAELGHAKVLQFSGHRVKPDVEVPAVLRWRSFV